MQKLCSIETMIYVRLKQLGFDGKVIVRDLWRQKDLGEYTTEFQTKVPYHGVTLVRIIPA